MNFLLDTHIFLWFVNDNPRLNNYLKDLIEDENNNIYFSLASLWEMSIKYNLGKLRFDTSYEEFVEVEIVQSRLNLLNINLKHFKINANLPFHHRDPFDRLIKLRRIYPALIINSKRQVEVLFSLLPTPCSLAA